MKVAKLFQDGQSQTVRLPKEFRFSGNQVYVKRIGDAIVLLPEKPIWDSLQNALSQFSDDFMSERNQSALQERDFAWPSITIPEQVWCPDKQS